MRERGRGRGSDRERARARERERRGERASGASACMRSPIISLIHEDVSTVTTSKCTDTAYLGYRGKGLGTVTCEALHRGRDRAKQQQQRGGAMQVDSIKIRVESAHGFGA